MKELAYGKVLAVHWGWEEALLPDLRISGILFCLVSFCRTDLNNLRLMKDKLLCWAAGWSLLYLCFETVAGGSAAGVWGVRWGQQLVGGWWALGVPPLAPLSSNVLLGSDNKWGWSDLSLKFVPIVDQFSRSILVQIQICWVSASRYWPFLIWLRTTSSMLFFPCKEKIVLWRHVLCFFPILWTDGVLSLKGIFSGPSVFFCASLS